MKTKVMKTKIDKIDEAVYQVLLESLVTDFAKKIGSAGKSVLASLKDGLEAGKIRIKGILDAIKGQADLSQFLIDAAKLSGVEVQDAKTAAVKLGDNTVVNAFLALAKQVGV